MDLKTFLRLKRGKQDNNLPNQWRNIPKYCVLLSLLATAELSFASVQQIRINKKNAKIEEVLIELRKQSNIDFFYNKGDLSKENPLNLNLNNVSLETALSKLLENTGLTYAIKDGIVVLSPKESKQQNITGRVVNQQGEGIANVSITAINRTTKSTSIGAQTKADGSFLIPVSNLQDTLTFSSVGYESRTIALNGRKTLEVVLKQKVQELEDVIVTGIYERKAESFTGSSMTIKKEDIKRMGSTNVFQSLKNISPSMFLDNFDMGSNPNTLPDLQIRGNGSLPITEDLTSGLKGNYLKSPSQPLFILDGFEASVERIFDLDINRIESVTILKDAASKAIYGSKAANGVIIIETTKMVGSKPIINYNMSVNVELPDLTSYNLTNSREKLQAEIIDGMYSPNSTYNEADYYIQMQKLYNTRKKLVEEGLDTYWLAKPLQNGVGNRHSLSAELGSEDLRVLTDFTFNNVSGAMIGSGRKNIGGNISASYRLNKFLFRNVASFTSNKSNESPYGDFSEYVKMNPYWRAVNEDGTIPFYAEVFNSSNITNPLYNSQLNIKNTDSYLNFTNNLYLEWMPIEGLRSTARIGIDTKTSDADEFYPGKHTKFALYTDEVTINRKGSYQVNNGKSTYLSGDLNINYSKQIEKNYFFGNLGYNVSEKKFAERVYFAEGFPSDRLQDIIFARNYAIDTRPSGLDGITRDMGFLAAFSYMWDNRFISDFTYRANASSQFGADRRWASFWSVGLGWNLHNEQWLKSLGYVDLFRIRGSAGQTGNQNFNSNASIATYKYALEAYYNGFPGSELFNMVNPGLQWESSKDYNAGLDLKVGPVGIRADYYVRYTENLLADITLPSSTGFELVKDNLGKIKNNGLEIYANYTAWQRDRNFLSLQFGIETNENKIVELSNSMKAYNDRMDALAADRGNNVPIKKYQDGMAMDAIWAVPSLGIDPATGNEIYIRKDGNTTYSWNASDMIVAGIERPKYQGTFGIQGEFKGVGLSVTARYLGGGQLYNQTLVDRVENVDMMYNVDRRVLTGRWLEPGQNALYKRLGEYSIPLENGSFTPAQEMTRATTRFVQDRKELDIASINLYYDFYQHAWLNKLKLQRLRASFNMNDVVKFSSIEIERGLTYPFSRTVSFSLNATF
ncbi:SusC/RagA family TonB-linked outer membrane protein [Sphingobacterium sp. CZ-2]|uniref:SusC/RagA family TonB-linked outer membrane protein n=1 Tax=Sphingobacterium sp. CZ-2 TaxID=2557994 RepID=UPI0010704A30|nr:SusC/RagA family TonB-linked outer membrane protein [Sphingobacterium sp. CZ-2]QBR12958.1 SusC/RagA family TonB-linked outer membrane protein [Sphingobacterium sp. CZ-2]